MKKFFYIPLFILLSLFITNCQSSSTSQLQATNEALTIQVNALMTQLTQQASSPNQPAQAPVATSAGSVAPTGIPLASPSPQSTGGADVITPQLIYSGSGTITPWTNKTGYPANLFGAANVHLVCDPNDPADGKVWIDKETYFVSCPANSESWFPWKPDITIGEHYIYSNNANDKYEFWTMGTPPFTIHNKFYRSDYMFQLNNPGIYKLSANLIKGEFNLYLTCEAAQNFTYKITQSTSMEVVLNPARCKLLIRDAAQEPTSKAEIEVSLEFSR